MGHIARQLSEHTTRYYWYPGEKREWARGGIALGAGVVALGVIWMITGSVLPAVVGGLAATGTIAGFNYGRRDARALGCFPDPVEKAGRRAAVLHTGRAAWRGMVEGIGAALAAVLIANLPATGVAADWLLPLVPACVGALAHQAGMLYERLGHASSPASGPRRGAEPATAAK